MGADGCFFVECTWAKTEIFLPSILFIFHFHIAISIMGLNITFV